MHFVLYYLDCLSQASYLVGDEGTRRAVVVDPRRDVEIYLDDADAHGLRIERVIETHIHADFLSGHLELAAKTGAAISYGEGADVDFPIDRRRQFVRPAGRQLRHDDRGGIQRMRRSFERRGGGLDDGGWSCRRDGVRHGRRRRRFDARRLRISRRHPASAGQQEPPNEQTDRANGREGQQLIGRCSSPQALWPQSNGCEIRSAGGSHGGSRLRPWRTGTRSGSRAAFCSSRRETGSGRSVAGSHP